MKHHDLKIEERYLEEVIAGRKTFEIRFNDRDYQVGDTVSLINSNLPTIHATIGYITKFQQQNNYVVFSLTDIKII